MTFIKQSAYFFVVDNKSCSIIDDCVNDFFVFKIQNDNTVIAFKLIVKTYEIMFSKSQNSFHKRFYSFQLQNVFVLKKDVDLTS